MKYTIRKPKKRSEDITDFMESWERTAVKRYGWPQAMMMREEMIQAKIKVVNVSKA